MSVDRPVEDYISTMRDGVKGMTVGVPVDRWIWERETEEVEDLVREAIDVLERLGAQVRQVAMPLAADTRATHFKISHPSLSSIGRRISAARRLSLAEIKPSHRGGE